MEKALQPTDGLGGRPGVQGTRPDHTSATASSNSILGASAQRRSNS